MTDPTSAWQRSVPGTCSCSQLRRMARAVSAIYDRHLAPAGLTVTQYAILVTIGRADGIRLTALADRMGMERTTLTRNLRPLEREKLIETRPGTDRRERLLHLSPPGVTRLNIAYPLWEQAQRQFASDVGSQGLTQLNSALDTVAQALGASGATYGIASRR